MGENEAREGGVGADVAVLPAPPLPPAALLLPGLRVGAAVAAGGMVGGEVGWGARVAGAEAAGGAVGGEVALA